MHVLLLVGFWLLGVSANQQNDQKQPRDNQDQPNSQGDRVNWLNESLTALEKAIGFFEKNYDQINLDGIFGLRVAQGRSFELFVYSIPSKEFELTWSSH